MSFKTIPDPIFYIIRDYINHNEYRNLMNTNRTRPFQEIKQKTIIFKFTPCYVYLYLTDESFRNHVLNLITNPRKQIVLYLREKREYDEEEDSIYRSLVNYNCLPVDVEVLENVNTLQLYPRHFYSCLGITNMSLFHNVEHIGLHSGSSCISLSGFQNLKSIYLKNFYNLTDLSALAALKKSLEKVFLQGCPNVEDINCLAGISTLCFKDCPGIRYDGMNQIGAGTKVFHIEGFTIFKNIPSFPLSFQNLRIFVSSGISNKFMIADLSQLEEVCLSYCSGVITLRDLPNLRKLTLNRVKLNLTASIILEKSILAQITHLNLSDGNPNLYTTEYLHDFFLLLENIQSFVFHYHDGIIDLNENLGKKFLPKLKEIVISSVPNLSMNLGLFPQISKLEISGWTLLDKNKTIGNIQLFMESSSFSLSSSSSSTVLSSYSLNSPVLKTLILKNCRRVEVNENFLNYLKQNINQTPSSSSLYSIQLLDCEIFSPLVLHCPKLYLQNSDFDSLLSEYCIPEQDQESSLQMKKNRNRIIALVDGSLTNVLSHPLFFQNIQILFLHQIRGLISLDGLEGIPRLIIDCCPQLEFLYPSTTTIDKIQHESIVLTHISLLKDIYCLRNVPRVSIGNCPLVRDFRCFLDSSCSYQLIEYTPFNLPDAKWFELEQEHESAWEKRLSSLLGYEELEARGKIMPYRNYPKYFPELAPSYSDLPKEVEFPFYS